MAEARGPAGWKSREILEENESSDMNGTDYVSNPCSGKDLQLSARYQLKQEN